MQILGISCGSPNGNSEILLKTALLAATSSSPTITTSLVSLQSLSLPTHAMPNHLGRPLGLSSTSVSTSSQIPDDRPTLVNAILLADALIISAPIYTRQPAGLLKAFTDTALGPFVDATFVSRAIKQNAAGIPRFKDYVKDYVPDERVLKSRVVGLIAVGGATCTEWGSLALPGLQQTVFSLHAKVVDQVIVRGCPYPGR
jgi:multimeric flavodoxin WrbA